MSVLQEAHDFVITGGDFRSVQQLNVYQHNSTGIDILRRASTPEAAVDAEERSYVPSCYPGTREQYIDDINNWATAWSNDNSQPIYWMKGPAGVGKSAIAQTCAVGLKDKGQLGAAFFFSINGRRKDHTRFFPTLAYQLATNLSADYRDYREIVNRVISDDQTLVKKTMASQFRSLIAEPLQELKEMGKELQRRPIFIDGLDECESQNAQVEIIQIIASSVRNGSTPFRWAIFSREESHIASTFADPSISPHCYSVFLPISREADKEIELYLRGGFRNILQRRNLLSLLSSWPAEEDIRKLVNAAAGLFAHSAIVLRFIGRHSYPGLQESLETVIASIEKPSIKPTSLYVELDKLYTLILQRVPEDIFPIILLFLSYMAQGGFHSSGWSIAILCNMLGISEAAFQSIYHHLRAVLIVQDSPQPKFDKSVALEHSYYGQDSTFISTHLLENQLSDIHGAISFYHKSFFDFITDPERSSTFCVTTPVAHEKFVAHLVQQHIRFASSYTIQGSSMVLLYSIDTCTYCGDPELLLAPGIGSSSVSLSWPKGTEFVDSFLQLWAFDGVSFRLSHDSPGFVRFRHGVPSGFLYQLAELDYRKSLIAYRMHDGLGLLTGAHVVGHSGIGIIRHTDDSLFLCINKDNYDAFDPAAFLRIVDKLEKAGVIRPFDSRLGASRVASIIHTFSRQKPYGRSFGQYKMGHGDKSIIWYWEFDTGKRYYHEFRTMNFAQAMAYYRAEKFKIWEWTDEDCISESNEEDAGDEDDVITDENKVKDEEDDKAGDRESSIDKVDDQVASG